MYEYIRLSSRTVPVPHLGFFIHPSPNLHCHSGDSNKHSNFKNSIPTSTWSSLLTHKLTIQKASHCYSQQAIPPPPFDDFDDDGEKTSFDFMLSETEENNKDEFLLSTSTSTSTSTKGEEEELEEEIFVNKKKTIITRQTMKRSNIIAKQVISVQSALTLGFVSQLWVDVSSWLVVVVEVRPNLLTGEQERFLLNDILQIGDVVLVEDESILENEFKFVALETLVGYNVVTPARRKIGRVRGYSFNVESGAIEFLELDSFGISIIPSSLVTTYALYIGDVLEVGCDTVVVHEAAASHIQRLTKGLWDMPSVGRSVDKFDEWPEPTKQRYKSKSKSKRGRKKNVSNRKRQSETTEAAEWELPMDYL